MRNKFMIFVTLVMTVIIFTGAGFTTFLLLYEENRDVIKVTLEEGVPEKVELESLAMVPGEVVVHDIQVFSEIRSKCSMEIYFEEQSERALNNKLKEYVIAAVHVNGEFICEKPLSEFLDGEIVIVEDCKLSSTESFDLTFTYIMPLDVGNEAQGADTMFNIVLTASNE